MAVSVDFVLVAGSNRHRAVEAGTREPAGASTVATTSTDDTVPPSTEEVRKKRLAFLQKVENQPTDASNEVTDSACGNDTRTLGE